MSKCIMIGCDLHDREMLLKVAVGKSESQELKFGTHASDRLRMVKRLESMCREHRAKRIVFAYEASQAGYGLSDFLTDRGVECHVLSPTHLPKTPKSSRMKTDQRDAQMILEQVRGYILAGNPLPSVWIPPQRLRDDRELVRARIDMADEVTRVKLRINSLLKRYEFTTCPTKTKFSKAHVRCLRRDFIPTLDPTAAIKLKLLLDQLEMFLSQQAELDLAIRELSLTNRYKFACRELRKIPGVGLLVAMAFLTEMGDLTRFHNRREIAAYLGLCPSSFESGINDDRKGRITRQGPARLRKMLCQAAWVSVAHCQMARETYSRIRQNQKHRSKKALVALMRKLAVKMWHRALEYGVAEELIGRGGPHSPLLKEPSGIQQTNYTIAC